MKEMIGQKSPIILNSLIEENIQWITKIEKRKSLSRKRNTEIAKENINIIADFIFNNFDNTFFSPYFPSNLKNPE